MSSSRLTLIDILKIPTGIIDLNELDCSAVDIDIATLILYNAMNPKSASFDALVDCEKWYIALTLHCFQQYATAQTVAQVLISQIHTQLGFTENNKAQNKILMKIMDAHVSAIIPMFGTKMLLNGPELLRMMRVQDQKEHYDLAVQHILTSRIDPLPYLAHIDPRDGLKAAVDTRQLKWIADNVPLFAGQEILLEPLITEWSFCKLLLDKQVLIMSDPLFTMIITRHRLRLDTCDPADYAIWYDVLRGAVMSSDAMFRRIIFVGTSMVMKKPAAADPVALKARLDRMSASLADEANTLVSWDEWTKVEKLDCFMSLATWEKLINRAVATPSLILRRRFLCFWLKNLKNTTTASWPAKPYVVNTEKIFAMLRSDPEWAAERLKAYRIQLDRRINRGGVDRWGHLLRDLGIF